MPIIYEGFLQTHVTNWIEDARRDYGHAIEMSSLPPNWHEWTKENLMDYTASSENCMGQPTTHQTKMYCLIHREDRSEPLFIFLKTQKEKSAVLRDFPDLIVNESPFKTAM